MEQEQDSTKEDVLSESALIPYNPESGVVVYIDYLTPTFHIPANLVLALIRSDLLEIAISFPNFPISISIFIALLSFGPFLLAANVF